MSRRLRMFIDNMPYHIVHRGHNRTNCFKFEAVKGMFFSMLCNKLDECGIKLHAFVLMSNHYHLLVTPQSGKEVPHFMQCLGRHFAGYYNALNEKTGTVWDGKYFASLVENDYYVLACYRYIELNPVRAGIVRTPDQYHWSSYHSNAGGLNSQIIVPHPSYEALGDNKFTRLRAYRELFNADIDKAELQAIRQSLNKNLPCQSLIANSKQVQPEAMSISV
ncbi:transposase [Alishewanella maricola]